jgi:hypothetical protein
LDVMTLQPQVAAAKAFDSAQGRQRMTTFL